MRELETIPDQFYGEMTDETSELHRISELVVSDILRYNRTLNAEEEFDES